MRLLRLLRLLALPPRDLLDAARAQAALLRARRLVRSRAVGSLVRVVEPNAVTKGPPLPATVQRLERAVARASRNGLFRPSCLVRSVALGDLLRRRGVTHACLRVGVRWVEGEFRAHAWVELDGQPVGDAPEVGAVFRTVEGLAVGGY